VGQAGRHDLPEVRREVTRKAGRAGYSF
jgi:hypothetical protein